VSLRIDTDAVTAVLLADGWVGVEPGSFTLDSYEYMDGSSDDALVLHGGGQSGVCATGFAFTDAVNDDRYYGPLTAVLAVKTGAPAGPQVF
jgi:hypothetical protein